MDNFTVTRELSAADSSMPLLLKYFASWSRLLLKPHSMTAIFFGYIFLVRALRYRRLNEINNRYPTRASLSKMTLRDAQKMVNDLAMYEFPTVYEKALQFALFRTYGIPTISSLLKQTSLFSNPDTACKRYVDTVLLIAEFAAHDVGSKRWLEATSRTNCIHAPYQSSGKITDDDMLYTLALFMREPCAWIDRCEWRLTTDAEKCASGLFWEKQGEALQIDYSKLPTYAAGKQWRDGLHFHEELNAWAEEYEAHHGATPGKLRNCRADDRRPDLACPSSTQSSRTARRLERDGHPTAAGNAISRPPLLGREVGTRLYPPAGDSAQAFRAPSLLVQRVSGHDGGSYRARDVPPPLL